MLAVGALLVVSGSVDPAVSFTAASLDRSHSMDVVGDPSGLIALDVAASVSAGQQSRLVDVTNHYGGGSVEATVTLQDGGDGTLHADGDSGDSVTVVVASGGTETVEIDVQGNPGTIVFDVTASSPWLGFSAPDRQTDVQGGPPGGGGPP